MFGIGTSEILIILVIALLILGPKEIPKIARTLGRGIRELERAKNELKETIEFEAQKADNQDNKSADREDTPDNTDEAAEKEDDPFNVPNTNSRV